MTFTGKLGASREKAQVFLGAFYGIPAPPSPHPLSLKVLQPLEQRLLSHYYSARDRLTSALAAFASAMETETRSSLKLLRDRVMETYQVCFKAQVRLARLRLCMGAAGNGVEAADGGGLYLEEGATQVDFGALSLSQLYKVAGCLVNTLLILCSPRVGRGQEAAAGQLPVLSREECYLLLTTLCVHGVARVHARACALLLLLCGTEPWWGEMVVRAASSLFVAGQSTFFDKERQVLPAWQ